jgi:biopolymer transport protein ExbB/TolQ
MSAHGIEQAIFDVADALLVPVLLAILAALAVTIVEVGRLTAELWSRRARNLRALEHAGNQARLALDRGDATAAADALAPVVPSARMSETVVALLEHRDAPDFDDWSAKALADFDYESLRRLERTRILVRFGPALGLMGTLIPLAPGLAALARGDTVKLSQDLRIAFSVTVLGLLVGAAAYAISLVRDRLYSHDLSDLEYLASVIAPPTQPDADDAPSTLEARR